MTDTARDFIIGVLTMTLLLVLTFFVAGKLAQHDKREACAKFAEATNKETVYMEYGLTESKCFISNEGGWIDINPSNLSTLNRTKP
jgi:hypothetical protein